ncbi:hypothetical protein GE061_011196 [Apolygus lucorum]|uniref:Uncharacterized protein n=1 Tax=Apolygus lucorum TaxID=248454 RepID=A0A8S9XZF1_APOLU|nr:hypothetical protein GE061_011196 [Apolygus lucorum]
MHCEHSHCLKTPLDLLRIWCHSPDLSRCLQSSDIPMQFDPARCIEEDIVSSQICRAINAVDLHGCALSMW